MSGEQGIYYTSKRTPDPVQTYQDSWCDTVIKQEKFGWAIKPIQDDLGQDF